MSLSDKTTPEDLATIQKVADILAPRFTFGYYDLDDIKQEIFMFCLDALPRFNPAKKTSLYTYLYTHAKNRLSNLKRNKLERPEKNRCQCGVCKKCRRLMAKRSLASGVRLDDVDENAVLFNETSNLANQLVDERLPYQYRKDYLKLLDGAPLPSGRKAKLKAIIQNILYEYNKEGPSEQE